MLCVLVIGGAVGAGAVAAAVVAITLYTQSSEHSIIAERLRHHHETARGRSSSALTLLVDKSGVHTFVYMLAVYVSVCVLCVRARVSVNSLHVCDCCMFPRVYNIYIYRYEFVYVCSPLRGAIAASLAVCSTVGLGEACRHEPAKE